MTYTVQLDFFIDEDGIRTEAETIDLVTDIFDYCNCSASNVQVLAVHD